MKKYIAVLLSFFLLLPLFSFRALGAEGEPEFRYELSIDGSDTKEVQTGDIITVTLYLHRTDADAPYTMHAMQSEIRYDSEFFTLVEDSALLSQGIQSTDIAMVDNHREFYMNYLSFSGGVQWDAKTRIGSFQLRVIGTSGVSTITNEDFLVSLPDGSGSYPCESNTLTVILTTDCTVRFETNGGSKLDDVAAIYGEKLTRPEDPVREGKRLVGWYKDIHLTEEWNFETDTVQGNMTLYAKWEEASADIPDETEPTEPGTETQQYCAICGEPCGPIPGIPLCLRCLLILLLLLLLLIAWCVYRHEKKKREQRAKNRNIPAEAEIENKNERKDFQ